MQDGNAALRPQRPKRILKFSRFLHRLIYECLDDRLAKWRELAPAKPAEESLHTGKTNAVDLMRLLVEDDHSGAVQYFAHLFRAAAFVIVVTKHAENRDRCRLDILGKNLSFLR